MTTTQVAPDTPTTDQEWHEKLPNRKHGKNDTYCTHGCRCSLCRKAHAEKKLLYSHSTDKLVQHADDSWMKTKEKNCHGMSPNVFFSPAREGTSSYVEVVRNARAVCQGCCVISECLEYAVATRQHGVWGGTDEAERRRIRRRRS